MKFIDNQTMVNKVLDDNAGAKKGETVTAINGIPVKEYGEQFAKRIPASTPQSLQQRLHNMLLGGDQNSKIRLTLQDLEAKTHEVELTRSLAFYDSELLKALRPAKDTAVFNVLPSGFGYVDLTRLQVGEVAKMFETLKNTPAIIFDMRGYPRGTAWAIAPRLTGISNVPAALLSRPFLTATALSQSDDLSNRSFTFTKIFQLQKAMYIREKLSC